jgi:hypothetical protein
MISTFMLRIHEDYRPVKRLELERKLQPLEWACGWFGFKNVYNRKM